MGPGLTEPLLRAGHLVGTSPVHALSKTPAMSNVYGAHSLDWAPCHHFAGPHQPSETRTCVSTPKCLKFATETSQRQGMVRMGCEEDRVNRPCVPGLSVPGLSPTPSLLPMPQGAFSPTTPPKTIPDPLLFSSLGTPWGSDHTGPFQTTHDLEICEKKLGFSASDIRCCYMHPDFTVKSLTLSVGEDT